MFTIDRPWRSSLNNVVVLPQYEFAMFCIPKAANSSIKVAILDALGERYDEERTHGARALNISSPQTVFNCCDGFFKATIVRNPFDRLVSCYESKIRDPYKCRTQGFSTLGFRPEMTFEDYIVPVCDDPMANIHFQPQLEAIRFCGKLLVDYIGKFEGVEKSWDFIRSRVKLNLGRLKHLNKTNGRRPYRQYYIAKTRRRVEATFGEDLNFFGYKY